MRTMIGCLALVLAVAFTAGTRAEDEKRQNNDTKSRTDDRNQDSKAFDDQEFVTKVASSGMHEVELGNLAARQASNERVKSFGEKMVKDHTAANEKLKTVAKDLGVRVEGKMLPDHQKHIEKFSSLKGVDFDRAYIAHMVESHEKSVAMFRRASSEAKNKALAAFAQETLPTLEGHLKMAKQLNSNNTERNPSK